jgi:undecaprenyl-diphosphatase
MIKAHLHGLPFSGKARDAFPSGPAIHIGALASAASRLPAAQRNTIWALSGGLVLTRVMLLGPLASDVAAGFCHWRRYRARLETHHRLRKRRRLIRTA